METIQKQLKVSKATVVDLQKQLADKEQEGISIVNQKEIAHVLWQAVLPNMIYQSVAKELRAVNDYTQLKDLSAKVSQQLIQYQYENKQKAVKAVQSNRSVERFVWIGLLLISLMTIGRLLVKAKRSSKKKWV